MNISSPKNQLPKNQLPAAEKTNRGLVAVLVGAIIGVLALGGWFLLAREQLPSLTEPSPDLATALGSFYMPAEFEPQEILYLSGEQLVALDPQVMTAIVRSVGWEVRVTILAGSEEGRAAVESLLATYGLGESPVEIIRMRQVGLWVRDFGPLTVTDVEGHRSMVTFESGKRRSTRYDAGVPAFLAVRLGVPILSNGLQVEGGDLLTNGRGFGVLSRRVVEANAGYRDKEPQEIVQTFAAMLGFENVMLAPPLVGEKSGHVDRFCTFLAADLVVVGSCDPAVDAENSAQLDKIAADLRGWPTVAGPMRVLRIPLPDDDDGVWRSHTTIVMANGVVLVPIYPAYCPDLDEHALAFYRRVLPEWQIVGVDASRLADLDATLRCITMNVPVGAKMRAVEAP